MPHKDGPAYFPYVCILSLKSGIMLNMYEMHEETKQWIKVKSFYLEPRSLFIFTEKHYEDHMHGIEEALDDNVD